MLTPATARTSAANRLNTPQAPSCVTPWRRSASMPNAIAPAIPRAASPVRPSTRTHDGREVEPVGQRVKPLEGRTTDDAHPAGGISHVVVADQADKIRPDKVADAPHARHLAVRSRTARTDDDIDLLLENGVTQLGETLGRIRAISIGERHQVAAGAAEA